MSEFFPLVRPEVPDAQHNKAPEILLEGMRTGLQAAAQFAQARRQSESEILRIAAQERMAQDEHAVQREKIYKDTEVQDQLMKMHGQYYDSIGKAALMKADAYTKGLSNTVAFNQQRQDLVNDVNDRATTLQLDDPKFATEDPVRYAANVMEFRGEYDNSPLPEVKNAITQYQRIADQQKITLKQAMRDEAGNVIATGQGRQVPIWKVVERLQNPDTHDDAVAELKASGHIQSKDEKVKRPYTGVWDWLVNPSESTVTKDVPDATAQKLLDSNVKFERGKSRVPPAMLPKSASKGTSPTELPPPDVPEDTTTPDQLPPDASAQPASSATPDYQPTDTDKMIASAKLALRNRADYDKVVQRLQENGIDPMQLWAT
jgi:hypothetical protein